MALCIVEKRFAFDVGGVNVQFKGECEISGDALEFAKSKGLVAVLKEDSPKRKRRTKAEMEADAKNT